MKRLILTASIVSALLTFGLSPAEAFFSHDASATGSVTHSVKAKKHKKGKKKHDKIAKKKKKKHSQAA